MNATELRDRIIAVVIEDALIEAIGAIASVAMLLRHTAKNEAAAAQIETAIESALRQGYRTRDIAGTAGTVVSTKVNSMPKR